MGERRMGSCMSSFFCCMLMMMGRGEDAVADCLFCGVRCLSVIITYHRESY